MAGQELSTALRAWRHAHARTALIGAAVLALAEVDCLLAGLSPWLPPVLALLAFLAVRPVPGLVYSVIVLTVPLGLWATGVQGVVGAAFGGRDYMLGLSAVAVVFVHFVRMAVRWRPSHRQLLAAAAAGLVLAAATVIGVVHHGLPQALLGVRFLVFPVAVLAVIAGRPAPDIMKLTNLLAWLLVANGAAAVAEFLIGPPRLAAWGFDQDRAIRYINGNFRAPGLTDFNAELGMLAGAYLLGYAALRLSGRRWPRGWLWHAGAAAAAVCLAASTSRSGAVLIAAGLVAATVSTRAGSAVARRRARQLGVAALVLLGLGFAAVGAVGAASLGQRLSTWGSLLRDHVPLYGLGVGAVGAASNSRVATGPQVFTDNYFINLAMQFGPVVALLMAVLLVAALGWLYRGAADHPERVVYFAVLVGLAASSLVIEAWEYEGAMACLSVFVAYAMRVPAGDAC